MEGLGNNQFLTGGLVLMIVGSAVLYLKTFLWYLAEILFRRIFFAVDVNNTEEAYRWLIQWLAEHPKYITSQRLTIMKLTVNQAWRRRVDEDYAVIREPPKILYILGPGLHIMWYKGRVICFQRTIERPGANSTNMGYTPAHETLTLYTIGSLKIIEDLVAEAMNYCLNKDTGKMIVFVLDTQYGSGWTRAISRSKRPMESVILDSNVAEEIVADAKKFLQSEQWYRELGVPYRRSYLLHGKPGCGKTSFVSALAGQLDLNVCVLTLSSKHITDSSLNNSLREAPNNAIILLEDIDALFPTRAQKKKREEEAKFTAWQYVTFSGLLNAIDGIAAQEGRIFVMTTNYINRLDPALLRPGRVDYIAHFGLATKNQARKMFLKFYPSEKDLVDKFVDIFEEDKYSMAQLQGYFLGYQDEPLKAIENFSQLKREDIRKKAEDDEDEDNDEKKEEENKKQSEDKKDENNVKNKENGKMEEAAEEGNSLELKGSGPVKVSA